MNIRTAGVPWLQKEHGVSGGTICVSKFYKPHESWTKKAAWAFEIDRSKIEIFPSKIVHLVCEKEPGKRDFYYLRVPSSYLIEDQSKLYIRQGNNRFSIFLSAEEENLFQDERGEGRVAFSQFLVS